MKGRIWTVPNQITLLRLGFLPFFLILIFYEEYRWALLVMAFVALIALLAMPYLVLLAILFLAGTTIIGSQTGANAACGALYPARVRTSGIGWALGIGRLGGIAAARIVNSWA